MISHKAAIAALNVLYQREVTAAAEAHKAGTVPRADAEHWAWTLERDKTLEALAMAIEALAEKARRP